MSWLKLGISSPGVYLRNPGIDFGRCFLASPLDRDCDCEHHGEVNARCVSLITRLRKRTGNPQNDDSATRLWVVQQLWVWFGGEGKAQGREVGAPRQALRWVSFLARDGLQCRLRGAEYVEGLNRRGIKKQGRHLGGEAEWVMRHDVRGLDGMVFTHQGRPQPNPTSI